MTTRLPSPWEALTRGTSEPPQSTDPLDDPAVWRSIVNRLGLNPMWCAYSIRDITAENGIDPERALAKFQTHFHLTPWQWKQ